MSSSLPSPGVLLGLPGQFEKWYVGQSDTFTDLMDWVYSDARFLGMAASTGSGKTLLAVLLAKLTGSRAVILTATKGLQAQVTRDFGQVGATLVVGQQNFKCLELPYLRCDEGPCHDGYACPHRDNADCPYHAQLRKALSAKLVVTNYAYWLAQTQFSSGLGDFDILVADEGHLVFGVLESHLTVVLPRLESETLGLHLPIQEFTWEVWQAWATANLPEAEAAAKSFEAQIKSQRTSGTFPPASLSRQFRSARAIVAKLTSMSKAQGKWVVRNYSHGWLFTPVWVAPYGHLLFRNIPKVLLMSAILSLKTLEKLGIPTGPDATDVGAGADKHEGANIDAV